MTEPTNTEILQAMRNLNTANLEKVKKQHLMKPVYAVKDDAVGFVDVLCQKNDAMAFRYFESACMNKESPVYKYAEQFALYKIGELDEQTGALNAELRLIAKAKDIVENGKDKGTLQ